MTGSEKIVLYNHLLCPFAARAVIALAETKHEYEEVTIDLTQPRPDWYLKDINPYGQVPAVKIDDKHVIYESLFVAEYLSDLHPEANLFPKDPLQRAQVRYLVHHYGTHVNPVVLKTIHTADNEEAAKHRAELIVQLEKFAKLLDNVHRTENDVKEGGRFFLGDQFSFADLAIAPFLARQSLIGAYNNNEELTADEFPQLKRFFEWKDAVAARPSVQKSTPTTEYLTGVHRKWVK
ncbi:hypothetical protein BGZ99_007487 [Dissophora globulifera]|uniref:Glutathione S-transferase n=1 Tax=Dissophora globulifera TaxID=979702 RepID=A0A9P6RC01_9FUNG|nr:hypothetical protein BGZ99_007487 [Dissophora globulifera]